MPDELGRTDLCLSADLRLGEVLAYFDFEGAWARIAHLDGVRAYPRGISQAHRPTDRSGPVGEPSEHVRRAVGLHVNQFEDALREQSRDALDRLRADSHATRLTQQGWVQRRSFLDPSAVARVVTNFPAQIVLVWGTPAPRAELGELFPDLLGHVRSAPFLFVASPSGVLAGFLSRPVNYPGASGRGMLELLRKYLVRIESSRLAISSLRTIVQHRYSALLRRPPEVADSD
ncbi:MAG TPA: hypothetical protein VGU43_04500 [Thermoplasmata archaeon]|nr:hypothetical protein [Thermoplasmata archaeon]